ncbi:MAG: alternative oxidase [Rubrivivax sp.]|nr:alternative oxidase [Rubrivivax sp.]
MPTAPRRHREPSDLADRSALGVTRFLRFLRFLRFFADTLFARRYGHGAIVLETVAAVPGMVGAMAPICIPFAAGSATTAGSTRRRRKPRAPELRPVTSTSRASLR